MVHSCDSQFDKEAVIPNPLLSGSISIYGVVVALPFSIHGESTKPTRDGSEYIELTADVGFVTVHPPEPGS
jgi:hypothetical protein